MSSNGQWIRPKKRLAIYLRDGLQCAYCGARLEDLVEEGMPFTLDHVKPRALRGLHHHTNLITCCRRCNSSKQDRTLAGWMRGLGKSPQAIKHVTRRVRNCRRRRLPTSRAAKLMRTVPRFCTWVLGERAAKQ